MHSTVGLCDNKVTYEEYVEKFEFDVSKSRPKSSQIDESANKEGES